MATALEVAGARSPGRANRLSADDWIDAASRSMVDRGVSAVAAERLADRLGVTKGSVCGHFQNRDALLRAMLERWAKEETEAAFAALDRIADPRERLEQLAPRAMTGDARTDGSPDGGPRFGHAFLLAVSAAADDPIVQPMLRLVSERRIEHLIERFGALGLPPDEARNRALLAYAAYVGTLRLASELPGHPPEGEASAAFRRRLIATLMLPFGD